MIEVSMKSSRQIWIVISIFAALMANACSKSHASSAASPKTDAYIATSTASNPTIRFLEARVKSDPEDFIALNKLAHEYLQMVREKGDITYLDLASRAANASLAILPPEKNKGGLVALIQVEYSSHNFAKARDHALQLIRLEPQKGYTYQMLGDALLELGQYDDAKKAFKEMEKLGGVQALTRAALQQRLARLALLRGDNRGAVQNFSAALKLLNTMPEASREAVAWTEWQLGETAFAKGDFLQAEKYYRDSLATFPDYFRSLASLGRVRAAQGDLAGATEQYERVVRILPDPNFVAALGDLYKLSGRDQDAAAQYALVENIDHLSQINGGLYNRQLALFYADHDLKPDEAYTNASKEYETRRDIYGADAVAWTALKAGKINEAQVAIKDAMRLGTRDSRLYYHAGIIAKSTGQKVEAIRFLQDALRLCPAFDPLQAVVARRALAELTNQSNLKERKV
jgi:pentatricopeptide repeat protein